MKKKADVVDWYSRIPKRFLPKRHNPNYDIHHIKVPFRMLITGSSGSGKTQTLLSLLHNMKNTFSKVVITTKNRDEPLYNWLSEKLHKEPSFEIREIDKDGLPQLDTFCKDDNNLLVMDDLVGESSKVQKQMEDYFLRARKLGCSLVYITQSYYAVPKMIRNNLNLLIIKQVSSMRNLTMILKEFDLGLTKEQLIEMYKHATADKSGFLLLDLDGEPSKKFRKNFDSYYEIDTEI
tara:strand:- start:278 stop:982 length:705 start_codon:yes stop_codon:yes gene_type:complete